MKILALESSAVAASCAISENGKIICESFINIGLTHSQTLLPLINQSLSSVNLTAKDIDIFSVAVGPGSFTGVRIGVATLKGLAFPFDKPCYGISTLEAMAWSCTTEEVIICPIMDARCMQVYTAQFTYKDGRVVRLTPDDAIKLDLLAENLLNADQKIILIGDGADKFYNTLKDRGVNCCLAPESIRQQHASGVALAAHNAHLNGQSPIPSEQLVPCYLRLSQAERERENKLKGVTKQ